MNPECRQHHLLDMKLVFNFCMLCAGPNAQLFAQQRMGMGSEHTWKQPNGQTFEKNSRREKKKENDRKIFHKLIVRTLLC